MRILVIGSGAREHAIAWKLAQSSSVARVYVAPGNAGTHREPKVENVNIDPLDFDALTDFVKAKQVDFTVVGPETPLAEGITDYFESKNCRCLGPTALCARLEGSKSFAKAFMQRHHIPTATAQVFDMVEAATGFLEQCAFPIVIKADGLAGGKGVVIAQNTLEAQHAIESMLAHNRFGTAGNQIIIEEFLQGEEVSFIVLSDGEHFVPFATSQDHKTRDDNDQGPNTGGMGAYSPALIVNSALHQKIIDDVIKPTLHGMRSEGTPFKGFLYAGLMISPTQEIKVLEFNCRFGDPETQPILMRLDSDFALMCLAALNGELQDYVTKWNPQPAIGVVLAANGYPDSTHPGELIPTLNEIPPSKEYKIFHAGTKIDGGSIVTNGGRVLCVTALGETLQEAQTKAYRVVKKAAWNGVFYRTDIGHRALKD